MKDNPNIGLFMDFENIVRGLHGGRRQAGEEGAFDVHLILDRLLDKGKILVKRAYCDWSRYRSYKDGLHEAAFELIDIPKKRVTGKNSADIRMVVDVLDLSFSKTHVDTFCLVTGDSDFSPLVSKLKENGRSVIGVGVRETVSPLLAENCDEFLFYEDLVKEREMQERRSNQRDTELSKKDAQAFRILLDGVNALQRDGRGEIWASMLKQTIQRKRPGFSEASYDYPTFSSLLRAAEEAGFVRLERDDRSGSYLVHPVN